MSVKWLIIKGLVVLDFNESARLGNVNPELIEDVPAAIIAGNQFNDGGDVRTKFLFDNFVCFHKALCFVRCLFSYANIQPFFEYAKYFQKNLQFIQSYFAEYEKSLNYAIEIARNLAATGFPFRPFRAGLITYCKAD